MSTNNYLYNQGIIRIEQFRKMSAVFMALGDTTNPWATQVVDFIPKAREEIPLPWYLTKSYL
ncbi:MAG: hypothetical protein K8R16_05270 [Anaerolineales bacterium]|nr:hypothetical protein [Anaerolineales bacterium]